VATVTGAPQRLLAIADRACPVDGDARRIDNADIAAYLFADGTVVAAVQASGKVVVVDGRDGDWWCTCAYQSSEAQPDCGHRRRVRMLIEEAA
jgi:hypothetical protein